MAYESSVPYRAGTEGYTSFRIPAVVRARSGALLAFAEGRVSSAADSGTIHLVLKRSADGGRTWGPLQVVARNGTGTAGNPAPVALDSGPLLLLQVHNAADATEDRIRRGQVPPADGRRVRLQYSDDDGATWSPPREITDQVKQPQWRWYATGPGHALQLRHGPYAGRLLVPANHSTPPADPRDDGTEPRYNGGHALLSDDDGATWRIGYTDGATDRSVGPNETTAAELPDGSVYLNSRNEAPSAWRRVDAVSTDGGEHLIRPFRPQAGLTGPAVQGSALPLGDHGALLFSGPAHPSARALMTLRTSRDGGLTWRTAHTVTGLPAAYSDLVRLDRDSVGLLYETGDFSAYSTITFRRIPVEEPT
ncbi:glycoside hydrolase [Streptomyces lydicamycinicus]|uniref:sialidase family protein n=1 Tax=Streptomyces lydicamycinicus TaxID=1546107 RepID=UPI002034C4D8|nr:sialidase family protein [Streptomyces lydicamycinicus]USA03442.1 glycoside hydrolase [Streptomyces lydicamycinicus]